MKLDQFPYPGARMPLFAESGIVATSQPLAAQAGLNLLRRGGNAVDAAIATAIALTVLEPTSNGIGGDAFALVWDGKRLHGLNGSGRAPRRLSAQALRERGHTVMPDRGWPAVTVPGAPAAWQDLHSRFGRLDFAELFAPAIAYARSGFGVSPVTANLWRAAADDLLHRDGTLYAEWARVFAPAGHAPEVGERFTAADHAASLHAIATRGSDAFYRGELAEKIVAHSRANGGLFDADDFNGHRSTWVDPIKVSYRDHEIWEIPPNGQGLAALLALGILGNRALGELPHGSESAWHVQIESMKLAFADAHRYIADPEKADVPLAGLLDPDYLTSRHALITEMAGRPKFGRPAKAGTVYLCAVDADGQMVSYIQSNYQGFGSGIVVPGTGIALHNRGAGFSLQAGHPNEADGGKRPFHTIIPAFLTRAGHPVGPFGVMGAAMQPQGHLQVVSSMLDCDMNPQAALDAPRWFVDAGKRIVLEPEVDPAVAAALAKRGHEIQANHTPGLFGRGQIIVRLDSGIYVAGSEKRADGAAVGW